MIEFRRAVRNRSYLCIGLIGPSGSGKTFSALTMAAGMADGGKIALLDTEAGRSLHYSDLFNFDVSNINPPFRPAVYSEAIVAAEQAGYDVIIVDSMSHEHFGNGGLLDWHDEELSRMAGNDQAKRERCNMAAWIAPKVGHKHMMRTIARIGADIIMCFRAERKTAMRQINGKLEVMDLGWQPICEKNMPYEMTCSLLLDADRPGIPQPVKIEQHHRSAFKHNKQIDRSCGEALAAWARNKEEQHDNTGS